MAGIWWKREQTFGAREIECAIDLVPELATDFGLQSKGGPPGRCVCSREAIVRFALCKDHPGSCV